MGADQSSPPPPPVADADLTDQELDMLLRSLHDRKQQLLDDIELLRMECIKGERLCAVMRIAHRKKEQALRSRPRRPAS
jgi:hypothetical protein